MSAVVICARFTNVLLSPPSAQVFDGLGDLLMPAVTPQSSGGSTAGSMGTPAPLETMAAAPPPTPPPTKTIGGDLDSSLANLVGGKRLLFLFCAVCFKKRLS